MLHSKTVRIGAMLVAVLVALALVGVGYGLWSKTLYIDGTVRTGTVNARFGAVFTDDDNKVDNAAKDVDDTGTCPLPVGATTSCDPSAPGPNPPRYEKDVGQCFAFWAAEDPDPDQPGNQGATISIFNAYPSYWCTAWFDIINNGSIPILIHGVTIDTTAIARCPATTKLDLDGDGKDDLEICVSGLSAAGEEDQIDPGDTFQMDLAMHLLQDAPQGETLTFDAEVFLHQWNEEPQ